MPLKSAIAIALAAILTPLVATSAYAAPNEPSTESARVEHAHKKAAPNKTRPSSNKAVAIGKRRHTTGPAVAQKDTKPDAHGVAISMGKPLDMPKVDPKKMDAKDASMSKKTDGRKREARKAESKKASAKKGDGVAPAGASVALAAAISTPLPPLPASDPSRAPTSSEARNAPARTARAPTSSEARNAPARTARAPLTINGKIKGRGKGPCLRAPIDVARGAEEAHLSLTTCEGAPTEDAIGRMSILLRPGGVSPEHAPKIDPRLLERLELVAEHFAPAGRAVKLHVISGSRPTSVGSYHQKGRAADVRVDGASNEEIVAFCKTLDDTGCGYYPNSSFVHIDAREAGTGHVAWIDASGPGEPPRYVSAWPVPAEEEPKGDAPSAHIQGSREMIEDLLSTLEKELPRAPRDEHPADAKDVPAPRAEIERDLP